MAPKRPSHLDDPPAASSSEEKEEVSSEEEEEEEDPSEDEEEEEEAEQNTAKKPNPQPSKSDADSSSESEPEDLAAATSVAVAVKPISSRPMDATSAGAKKPRSKPPATPAKRTSDDAEASKSSKRSRKKSTAADHSDENGVSLSGDESKKPAGGAGDEKKLFQRLWSEDDEIVILKGMIDYASKKGSFPTGDNMEPFHDSIKKSIHFEDFTKSQLADKVRRLRKKFQNNLSKTDYDPTRTHDKKIFDLSKKIWGSNPAATPTPKANGFSSSTPASRSVAIRSGAVKAASEIGSPLPATPPSGGGSDEDSQMLSDGLTHLPKSVVSKGLDLVPEDKKAELLAEWEKIHLAEIELFVRKSKLMSEQAKLISEALKHSN